MKKFSKMLGVTLLEVMLVLAVAAMIIVMSVRYYQTASANQQVNSMLSMVQAITASADGLAQGTGSYSGGGVSTSTIKNLMPNQNMNAPWGSAVTLSATTASTYTVTFTGVPQTVCAQVKSRLAANQKYTGLATIDCSAATNTFTYVYDQQS